MITIKGDLLKLADEGNFDIIVHGCNCFNTMGAGIAWAIARKYPQAKLADNKTTRGDKSKLGKWTVSNAFTKTSPVREFLIVNAYTQYGCNAVEHKDLFEYEAFQSILNRMVRDYPEFRIGFPLIGCGLAGGDKVRIMRMIDEFSKKVKGTVTVVEWDKE